MREWGSGFTEQREEGGATSKKRSKIKTLERHHLYTEDTVTVTAWPRMMQLRRRSPVHSEGEQRQWAKQQEARRISGCYIPGAESTAVHASSIL